MRDCDAAVAIFWTKFGTPTDKYGSGTEEEIEEMLRGFIFQMMRERFVS